MARRKSPRPLSVQSARRMRRMIHELPAYTQVGGRAQGFTSVNCEAVLARVLRELRLLITECGVVVTHDFLPIV
jgi:chemotaxis family two-component system sensor kinase Cph1